MNSNIVPLIAFGILLIFAGIFYIVTKKKDSISKKINEVRSSGKKEETSFIDAYKKNPNTAINKEDIFKFMEFDKIQDNMIIQQGGSKFTAVIKCKGINYSLMSEVEQLSVEEGFMTFLNTLKYPIQIYVQAQTVDLKNSIKEYKENMKNIINEYEDLNHEYNMAVNSLENSDDDLEAIETKRSTALNVLEYGQDIVRYVEKLSLNKSMLQRNFYILVSYYKAEITNVSSFKKDEIVDICYTELFTRVQSIMSGLSMCSIVSEILTSNNIAELLYSAYNRDDKNYINVSQALEAGFHRLYSTSEDAVMKKQELLFENIKKEAEFKAIEALAKAVDEGNLMTYEKLEDQYDQESSKKAIDIIKNEKIDDETKNKAKKIVIDEYKKAKKERMERQEQTVNETREKIKTITGERDFGETVNPNGISKENVVEADLKNNDNSDVDSIV